MHPRGLRRTSWASLLGLLAGTLTITGAIAGLSVAPAAASTTVKEVYGRPASGHFTLAGHGWGHGHGLSQYGAQGAFTLNRTADEITTAYYPNTVRTVQANAPIRIKLSVDTRAATREFIPASGQVLRDLATAANLAVPTTATKWVVTSDANGLHVAYATGSGTTTLPGTYAGPLQVSGGTFVRVLLKDGTSRDYRTSVRVIHSGSSVIGIAVMSMESYLLGVVPRESLSSWGSSALQAQAIAARSYSTYKRDHVSSTQVYDICDTTQCQVFSGSAKYTAGGTRTSLEPTSTTNAVNATAGVIRTYGGKAVFAEFSASNGGWSTDGGLPYLVAHADPWDGVTGSSVHSWTATLPVTALESYFASKGLGSFRSLTITQRDGNGEWGGRVEQAVLTGVDSAGNPTSVSTTGSGLYYARPWTGSNDGLRSRWFHIIPEYDAVIASRGNAPTLVLAPGNPKGTVLVNVTNTGASSWPVSGLHLALANPAGGADPLSGGSTRPGTFVKNLTDPTNTTSVDQGQQGQFAIALDATGLSAGLRKASYRVQLGTAALFGATATWTIDIENPVFTAAPGGAPTLVSSSYTPADGAPPALWADGRTVLVPRTGSTTVRVSTTNTGNITWPVGSASPLQLGTSGPRERVSDSATTDWINAKRPAHLAAAASVGPHATGTFDVPLAGNGKPAGVTTEAFEPVWQGQSWISGAATALTIVRVDTAVSRAAVTDRAPATGFSLVNAPTGRANLVVRLRNVGGQPWTVGQEQLRASAAVALGYKWPSSTQAPALARNVNRPDLGSVWPGEVGEWIVPLTATNKAPGDYAFTLRPATPSGSLYGPSLPVKVTVVAASFSYTLFSTKPRVDVPRGGTATTAFSVKNTSNFPWPVGTVLRSTVPSGSSPSRATTWFSATRPGVLSLNASSPGSSVVRPGEVATFRITLAGNNRAPAITSEVFGMSWDGWRNTALRVTLTYRLV